MHSASHNIARKTQSLNHNRFIVNTINFNISVLLKQYLCIRRYTCNSGQNLTLCVPYLAAIHTRLPYLPLPLIFKQRGMRHPRQYVTVDILFSFMFCRSPWPWPRFITPISYHPMMLVPENYIFLSILLSCAASTCSVSKLFIYNKK